MSIETEFTIKNLNVQEALSKAESKVQKSASKMNKSLDNGKMSINTKTAQKSIHGVKKGFQDMSKVGIGEAGKLKGAFEGFSSIFSPITAKFALLGGAISILTSQLKAWWDDLTLSAQEASRKNVYFLEQTRKKIADVKTQQEQDNGYLDRLREMTAEQLRSNEGKLQASNLIALLTKRYGDLGVSIDMTTWKVIGLDKAQRRMLQQQQKETLKLKQVQLSTIKASSQSKARFMLVSANAGFGSQTLQEQSYQQLGRAKQSTWDIIDKFQGASIEQQIKFLQRMLQDTKRSSDITNITQVLKLKREQLKVQQQIVSLKTNKAESENDFAKRLKQETSRSNEVYSKQTAKEEQKQKAIQAEINKKQREQKLAGMSSREKVTFLKSEYDKQTADLQELEAKKNAILSMNQKSAQDKVKTAKVQTEILQKKKQQMDKAMQIKAVQEMIAQQRKATAEKVEKYNTELENLNQQVSIQQLILEGKIDEAQKQTTINQLKAKGLSTDRQSVDEIMKRKQALKDLSVKSALKQSANALINAFGSKDEQEYQMRKKQLQEAKGTQLTAIENEQLKKQIEFSKEKSFLDLYKVQGDLDIKTNDLTRRGGFAGGAVLPSQESLNRQIKDLNIKQVSLLTQIKNSVKNGGLY